MHRLLYLMKTTDSEWRRMIINVIIYLSVNKNVEREDLLLHITKQKAGDQICYTMYRLILHEA